MSDDPIKVITAPATVVAPIASPAPAQVGDVNIAPRTTAEQDTATAGQRRVNLIWEHTQAAIAITMVGVTLYVTACLSLLISSKDANEAQISTARTAFMLIGNLASLIIGFYFGRTNHQKIGGVASGDAGR